MSPSPRFRSIWCPGGIDHCDLFVVPPVSRPEGTASAQGLQLSLYPQTQETCDDYITTTTPMM
jgi:hypothetical protein